MEVMTMKIKYITEDGITTLRENANIVFSSVIKEGNSLLDVFPNIVRESSYETEPIVLDVSQPSGKETLTDIENVIRVYNHLKHISDSLASEERLWVALSLVDLLDYMKYRWPADNEKDVLNRYFFNYSSNRSLFRNGISRLWWIGRVTYDSSKEDPFELTRYLCKDQDFIESICGRTMFNNHSIQRATVRALYDAEKAGVIVDRQMIRETAKYVNLLGGVYMIDFLTEGEIYEKTYAHIAQENEKRNAL